MNLRWTQIFRLQNLPSNMQLVSGRVRIQIQRESDSGALPFTYYIHCLSQSVVRNKIFFQDEDFMLSWSKHSHLCLMSSLIHMHSSGQENVQLGGNYMDSYRKLGKFLHRQGVKTPTLWPTCAHLLHQKITPMGQSVFMLHCTPQHLGQCLAHSSCSVNTC